MSGSRPLHSRCIVLAAFDRVWAAAGSPTHVFATTPDELLRLTGGAWAVVREG